jgi:hypothetical protein
MIEPIPFAGLVDLNLLEDSKRFCTSCQTMKSTVGGEMVGEKIRRWLCLSCQNKKSSRRYESKK